MGHYTRCLAGRLHGAALVEAAAKLLPPVFFWGGGAVWQQPPIKPTLTQAEHR